MFLASILPFIHRGPSTTSINVARAALTQVAAHPNSKLFLVPEIAPHVRLMLPMGHESNTGTNVSHLAGLLDNFHASLGVLAANDNLGVLEHAHRFNRIG